MTSTEDFHLPDVGEGLTEAEVLEWHVGVGDHVEINDIIVEIETAKSAVELPSPFAGTVSAIHVEPGTTIDVGTRLITIAVGAAGQDSPTSPPSVEEAEPAAAETVDRPPVSDTEESTESSEAGENRPLVLVGTGPKDAAARRRRIGRRVGDAPIEPTATSRNPVQTKPPMRALAKQLGVDLERLTTEVEGVITRADIEAAAGSMTRDEGSTQVHREPAIGARETRIPVKGVRKVIAEAMTRSAFSAPHVTEWLAVDVTTTMETVARLKGDPAWAGVRINPMVFVARAFLLAIRSFPDINASWDAECQEIVLKHFVNLGIAAATPRGLIVPNIKDAQSMDLRELAGALESLVAMARSGKTPPADMSNGTITITNIGALGVDAGTPILNPGEAAILAFGAVRPTPWVVQGEIQIRQVTQLALSFDHRLVDGELGSRVLERVAALLNDPGTTFLYA